MLGKIFSLLCLSSFLFGCINGKMEEISVAVLDSAGKAVTLTLSLLGMMCLWCGILQVARTAGLIQKVSFCISPLLKFLFPTAYRTGNGIAEISANLSANILGIGNAATPFALKAMDALQRDNPHPESASDDMVTFAVLNTASLDLLPTTLIALRRASGSEHPFSILVPVWICSFAVTVAALFFSKVFRYFTRVKERRS